MRKQQDEVEKVLRCVGANKERDKEHASIGAGVGLGDQRPNKVTNKQQVMGAGSSAGPSKGLG